MNAMELHEMSGCSISMCENALRYAAVRDGGDLMAISYLKAKTLAVKTHCSFNERVQRFMRRSGVDHAEEATT